MRSLIWIVCIIILLPVPGYAYVGPGLGLGALGAIAGIIFSIFLAIFAVFWYPIKRVIGKFRGKKQSQDGNG